MESSPLSLAHDHARAASIAAQSADTTVAINEHALAAGEFAKAATGTGSVEALRTLRLLEHHHQRLSELLRYPTENPPTTASGETEVQATTEKRLSTSAAVAELRASKSDLGPRAASPLRTPPSLPSPRRLPPRDLSSSIASNLASARGIRANYTRQPLAPSVSAQQAPGSLESLPRKHGEKRSNVPASIPEYGQPSWLPPTQQHKSEPQTSTSKTSVGAEPAASVADEGFSKFYSAFENILYKISAPLAFAGLPLTSEDGPKSPELEATTIKKTKASKNQQPAKEPKFLGISPAALRASAREGQSGTDSFYVVPTSGQTVSYAHILSFAEKEKRRLAASMHNENPDLFADLNEEDDFVDARETPMPPTPTSTSSRTFITTRSKSGGRGRDLETKVEELSLENHTLKDAVDKLTKRIRTFELAAQSSSMALQESMRLIRDTSPAPPILTRENSSSSASSPSTTVTAISEALKAKVHQLEETVRASGLEIDKLGKENEKLRTVLAKYRDRWETLKEGAKTRREGGVKKDGGGEAGQQQQQQQAGSS